MNTNTFSIYQIPCDAAHSDVLFVSYDRLESRGLRFSSDNYKLVYTAPLEDGVTLEDIFTRFNINHPADYCGRSLSVSDVVVLHQGGKDTAHYVDSIGFVDVPWPTELMP